MRDENHWAMYSLLVCPWRLSGETEWNEMEKGQCVM